MDFSSSVTIRSKYQRTTKVIRTHPCGTMDKNIKRSFRLVVFSLKQVCLYETLASAAHLRISIQRQDLLLGIQQLAGVRNIDSRLLFVARQHPYLQAGLPQRSYGFRDAVLQPVLDACCSCG